MACSYFAGLDVGSTTTKAVIIDGGGVVLGRHVVRSGASFTGAASSALGGALAQSALEQSQLSYILGTGYGRSSLSEVDATRTEIACHGRGAYEAFSRAITVIDIGGQDSKIIVLDRAGRRQRFTMNRKCAAGTGAFIEEMAHRLDVPLGELDGLARKSTTSLTLNSFCTVFAATEVLAHIRQGVDAADLARAAFRSVPRRLMETQALEGELVLTGGVVAHNPVLAEVFVEVTGVRQPLVPPEPQLTGALGAALLARDGHTSEKGAQ